MKYVCWVVICCMWAVIGWAQVPCATEDYGNTPSVDVFENEIAAWIQKHKNTLQTRGIVTIPVVFHIVYNADEENVPDSEVQKQIEVLNRDFRRRNGDTINTPMAFKVFSADVEIEFCLAARDTLGNPTTGINRFKTFQPSFTSANNVKNPLRGGVKGWNPNKYLNVWVCNLPMTIYGLGTYPTLLKSRPNDDGVVINYRNFGVKTSLVQGRTLVHEVGHWLNLLHIFGDSSSTACAARTDYVDDTPQQRDATSGCPAFPKRDDCTPLGNGNMFMNYMDYTRESCSNLFTLGQKARMWAALNLYRSEILNSNGCLTVPTNDVVLNNFSIAPNPSANGIFQLNYVENDVDLTVSNIVGQSVLIKKHINVSETVDISNQPPGIYFMTLKKGTRQAIRKVVKSD